MKKSFLLFILTSYGLLAMAQPRQVYFVPASDPNIQYIGRFDFSAKDKPAFMYSGCTIRTSFTGTSVSVLMQEDSLRNWFTVKLDDSIFIFKADKKDGVYSLAQSLPDQKHLLEISRRTEWHGGNTTFSGFNIDEGKKLEPVKRYKRLMEFIGDSYTCGYGNEGKSREDHFSYETENNYASFGAITARSFNAGYIGICRSGIGMYQGYGGDKTFTQPNHYDETITGSTTPWDYATNQVQVVIIDLGANDLSVNLDSAQFVNTYIKFVQKIRLLYPKAKIVCVAGPSGPGDQWVKFQSHVEAVAGNFKGIDKRIYYFKFSPFEPNGSDWHPNVKEHQQMANELIPFIAKITKW
ncbi:MAG: SGNH/GDSL hydrolase family protein [Ferruginibacter sp.]